VNSGAALDRGAVVLSELTQGLKAPVVALLTRKALSMEVVLELLHTKHRRADDLLPQAVEAGSNTLDIFFPRGGFHPQLPSKLIQVGPKFFPCLHLNARITTSRS